MHNHACGFVDDDQILIFVNDFDRDIFGNKVDERQSSQLRVNLIAGAYLVRRFSGATIHDDVAIFDQSLQSGTTAGFDVCGEECVEPLSCRFLRNYE